MIYAFRILFYFFSFLSLIDVSQSVVVVVSTHIRKLLWANRSASAFIVQHLTLSSVIRWRADNGNAQVEKIIKCRFAFYVLSISRCRCSGRDKNQHKKMFNAKLILDTHHDATATLTQNENDVFASRLWLGKVWTHADTFATVLFCAAEHHITPYGSILYAQKKN